MNILVTNNAQGKSDEKKVISRDLICTECKENILIDIKNFKINLHKCKNNHAINNILLNRFEETQKIDLSEIIFGICKQNNKGNAHNNEFYICNTCNKNICPLCRSVHDKKHKVINYDDKNYICQKHNDSFTKYCKTCNINICIACENKHDGHDIFDFKNILIDEDDLLNVEKELKNSIDNFKMEINIIKEIFDKMINILDSYYKLNDDIINNYNINKRNYFKLQNLNYLKKNSEKLIQNLNNMINNDNISEIYKFALDNFYNENGEKYIGEIKNGLKDGKGILYYNKDDEKKRKKYEGEYKNGKREGKGIMYWNNGDRYEGEYKNGKKEGKRIYYQNNGNRYEGEYKNGKRERKGIMYWNNGDRYEGEFKNDEREGKGIMYYNNGKIEDGDWKDNKFQKKGFFNLW